MRFILGAALSLPLLILVSAAPTGNLKDELRPLVEETHLRILQKEVNNGFALAKSIVNNRVADQEIITFWQNYIKNWEFRNESLLQNVTQCNEFHNQTAHLNIKIHTYNKYTNGDFFILNKNFTDFTKDRLAVFETKATEIIRVAKEAGYANQSY